MPPTLEHLQQLDQAGRFQELDQALQALAREAPCPAAWQGPLAYWRGKVALLDQRPAAALPALALACQLQPQRPHAHYLLGVASAHCRHWGNARQALEQALALDPAHQPSRLELGRVLLALGEHAAAAEQLQAVRQAAAAGAADADLDLPRESASAWARAAVRAAPDPASAAQLAAVALAGPQRLADGLLAEWLQIAGGLLLLGFSEPARAWLAALAQPSADPAACGHPVPRRPALLALLLLEQLEPHRSAAEQQALAAELRSLLWLPASELEQEQGRSWLAPLHQLLLGRLQAEGRALEPALHDLLLAALPLPAAEHPASAAAAPQVPPGPAMAAPLQWHRHDLPQLLQLWPQLLAQPEPALRAQRPQLEAGLAQLSALMLDRPPRLVLHPDPAQQQQALHWRQRALTQLIEARQRLASLDPPLPPHPRPRRRWLLLASDDLPQCFLYRVQQKREQLEALGCECRILLSPRLNDWLWSPELLWADAVIVCRLPALDPVLRAITAARQAGLPIYYDIDDLIFDPQHCPPDLATYGGTLDPAVHRRFALDVPLYAAAARACDGLIVSTPTLAQRWQQLQGQAQQPVWLLPNLAPPALRRALQPPRPLAADEPLRLVVASGTTAHKQAWQQELAPALALLLERHPQLQLDLLGHLALPLVLQHYSPRIRCRPYTDYPRYLQQLGQAAIGLVVLEPGTFTDAKSAIRWMEFSYLGLAAVLSPTRTYTELLQHGEQARFARGTAQWIEQIEALIADPAGRLAMAQRAQAHAQALFGPHQAQACWRPLLDPPAAVPSGRERRRRLLIPHVFFAPQSIGGATRVVQDHVQALLEQAGDRYAITVLCTDHQPWQLPAVQPRVEESEADRQAELDPPADTPLAVQVSQWLGVRVVRLALPPRPWRHHRHGAVAAFCQWWLAQEGFDLIHAHCLQVLSIEPLRCAAALGIPYAVTLHDGWWLSPSQFLTTPSGRAVDPADPLSHYDHPSRMAPALLEADRQRRQELEQLLRGAAACLAVSAPFAALHHQAGLRGVAVMENRWQPMPPAQPRGPRAADQPLRACCIGGMAIHKGLAVLQAALLQAHLPAPGLQLTLVDASLEAADSYRLQWGDAAVQVRPSVPMAAMAAFYANHDLLIAPSIWPESYGLVTREALSAGLWVIASDIGALAEPIRHGQNGHRLPPGDAAALAAVLEQLCADHPTPQPLLAFNGAQPPLGLELDQLYSRLLAGGPGPGGSP